MSFAPNDPWMSSRVVEVEAHEQNWSLTAIAGGRLRPRLVVAGSERWVGAPGESWTGDVDEAEVHIVTSIAVHRFGILFFPQPGPARPPGNTKGPARYLSPAKKVERPWIVACAARVERPLAGALTNQEVADRLGQTKGSVEGRIKRLSDAVEQSLDNAGIAILKTDSRFRDVAVGFLVDSGIVTKDMVVKAVLAERSDQTAKLPT